VEPPTLQHLVHDALAVVDEPLDRIGDLELAARRRLDGAHGVVDGGREQVDAGEGEVRRRMLRLLDEAHDVAGGVDLGHAEAVGVGHGTQQDLGHRRPVLALQRRGGCLLALRLEALDEAGHALLDHVVAEVDDEVVVAEEVPGDAHAVPEAEGRLLADVGDVDPPAGAVAHGGLDLVGGVAHDDAEFADARRHHVLEAVEQDRLVGHGHQLLRAGVRDRPQPRPGAAREDQSLHRAVECGTAAPHPTTYPAFWVVRFIPSFPLKETAQRDRSPWREPQQERSMDTGFAPRSLLRRMGSGVAALLVALTTLTVLVVAPSPAHAAPSSDEQAFLDQTNATRAQNGLGPLQWDEGEANIARSWSSQMAGSQTLSHNPNLVAQTQAITPDWQRVGENVGFGPTVDALQNAFVNSPPPFANIVGDYNRVGIGVVRDGNNTIWVTLDFVKGPDLAPPPPPPTPTWFLRDTLTTGVADSSFLLGDWGDKVISCDWNGDGTDTPGIFRNGQWYYTNQLGSGGILTFSFGSPGDVPVCGDWDGNGTDTPGVFRNGMFFLRNSNSSGVADLSFPY